jgi:hypothetical protein
MKTHFCSGLIAVTALLSCGKSASNPSGAADWQLLYKYKSIGSAATRVSSPAPDSMVYLQLNADSSYFTKLNNTIVSQNNYSIITTTNGSYTIRAIELKGFKPTGIFSLFPIAEIGSNNQVIAVYAQVMQPLF